MLTGNQLEIAFKKNGFGKNFREKRNRKKKVNMTCNRCNNPMELIENTNVVACTHCSNYFIFSEKKK